MREGYQKVPTRSLHHRLFSIVVAIAIWGLPTCHLDASAQMLSDQENRNQIEKMYNHYKRSFPTVRDITPQQTMNLRKNQKVIFVDVREVKEQEVSMLPGALTKEEFLNNLQKYEDEIIIGYCTISYRSGKLARKLAKQGITMLNLRGGILAWVHDGGKVYDQYGETKRIHVHGRKWNLAPKGYEAIW